MMQRRKFLKALFAASALAMLPIKAFAAIWNTPAFQATKLQEAIAAMKISNVTVSNDIQIIAPDKAENGAVVQIEITSLVPNTESIAIFVENNPTALIANFVFGEGADGFVITRIKMAETSDVQAVIKSNNRYYSAKKRVEVLENGCG
ncbi:thiosulfate oxidation carrier protein SoxY [Candidatus Methylopumilus turicensis]|uniref:Transmembrane proetin, twin-arginine translocation pathway signal n=1 Tax=Candidatus Methylopumilus turicensis TaxID=1581680 RepID=A0A0B7IXI8_9PROT|nr:thiosulfate oxidation carrier protein SoxY [Candidatus Methylopumilus turicensis]CEN55205.1 Transmembrane proetin, twin-arginine translocation pathway signal [Candidatus Methylopumilus turicensis]